MQGKIISFDFHDDSGSIIADDGMQYVFGYSHWKEPNAPKAGDDVNFTVDNVGNVSSVAYRSNQPHTTMPPPIPANLSKRGSNSSEYYATQSSSQQAPQNSRNPPVQYPNNTNFNQQPDRNLDALQAQEENYSLVDWTKKVVLENYTNFNGRARRKEFWFFYLAYFIVNLVAVVIDYSVGMDEYGLFQNLLGLALLIPTFAVGARRLHDIGRSGWWQLLLLIPIIGWILLIIWLAKDTSPETNQYGAPARHV